MNPERQVTITRGVINKHFHLLQIFYSLCLPLYSCRVRGVDLSVDMPLLLRTTMPFYSLYLALGCSQRTVRVAGLSTQYEAELDRSVDPMDPDLTDSDRSRLSAPDIESSQRWGSL